MVRACGSLWVLPSVLQNTYITVFNFLKNKENQKKMKLITTENSFYQFYLLCVGVCVVGLFAGFVLVVSQNSLHHSIVVGWVFSSCLILSDKNPVPAAVTSHPAPVCHTVSAQHLFLPSSCSIRTVESYSGLDFAASVQSSTLGFVITSSPVYILCRHP